MSSPKIKSINPATGQLLKSYEPISDEALLIKLHKSRQAFQEWRKTSFSERSRYLKKVADHLEVNKRKYGEIITTEMGKPIKQAVAEVEKCALACLYYADHAKDF